MKISQTKFFSIFPGSIQLCSMSKILSAKCNKETSDCIPQRDLPIDCRNFNSWRLAKNKTNARSDTEQFCYFKQKR